MNICLERMPEYTVSPTGHRAACWLQHPDAPKVEVETGVKRGEI